MKDIQRVAKKGIKHVELILFRMTLWVTLFRLLYPFMEHPVYSKHVHGLLCALKMVFWGISGIKSDWPFKLTCLIKHYIDFLTICAIIVAIVKKQSHWTKQTCSFRKGRKTQYLGVFLIKLKKNEVFWENVSICSVQLMLKACNSFVFSLSSKCCYSKSFEIKIDFILK